MADKGKKRLIDLHATNLFHPNLAVLDVSLVALAS